MTLRALGAIFVSLLATVVLATPDCLIAQIKVPLDGEDDPNFSIAPFVADALDHDGRVRPVVWSLTDPIFREWTSRDVFGQFEPNPTAKQVMELARKLGINHVLIIYGFRTGESCNAIAELYVGGRNVWKFGPRKPNKNQDIVIQSNGQYDQKATRALQAKMPELLKAGGTFTVMKGGIIDVVETARSVGNTWAALLADGPLKNLQQKPRIEPKSDNNIQADIDLETPVDTAESTIKIATDLIANKKANQAISLLRAGIDRFPFEPTLRECLVVTLTKVGFFEEASQVATGLSVLRPGDPKSWLILARTHISCNDADNASQAVNQALTLGAKGETLLETLGDLALLKNDPKEALFRYSQLKEPSSKLRQAIAQALAGDREKAGLYSKELSTNPLSTDDYELAIGFFDGAFDNITSKLKNLMPDIRLGKEDSETLHNTVQTAECISDFIAAMIAPSEHKDSHESRKLAYILLRQACLEAKEFSTTNNSETGDDAVATLGQAIRLLKGVREKYRLEQKFGGF